MNILEPQLYLQLGCFNIFLIDKKIIGGFKLIQVNNKHELFKRIEYLTDHFLDGIKTFSTTCLTKIP